MQADQGPRSIFFMAASSSCAFGLRGRASVAQPVLRRLGSRMAKLAFCRVSVAFRKASSPQADIMADPPLDTKGKVTPVRGRMSTDAEHVQAGLEHHQGGGGAGGDGVEAGPPRPAGPDGEHRQGDDGRPPPARR